MREYARRFDASEQAAGLRSAVPEGRPARVISVTGGKGGVGKSNVSLNLAIALAERGERVMLLDADLGLANVDVLLGLRPGANLAHVLEGSASLDEVVIDGPRGVRIVPGASGIHRMAHLSAREHFGLINAFADMEQGVDTLIVDTAAGISDTVTSFAQASQEVLVVVCDEPASLTDAYALIKVMHRDHRRDRFRIVANMCPRAGDGRELYLKILRVCDRYLDVSLDFAGAIPFDEQLRKSVQLQRAVVDAYPSAPASIAFKKLAQRADTWPVVGEASGRIEFFVERLVASHRLVEESPA